MTGLENCQFSVSVSGNQRQLLGKENLSYRGGQKYLDKILK